MSSPADKILAIQRDLLRIQTRVLRVTDDIETLAAELNPTPPAPGSPVGFERDILLYNQRRAARRLLVHAVNAGALLPRDALGFTIEAASSDDEDRDTLNWRARAVESPTNASVVLPAASASTPTGINRGVASNVATGNPF
eukprot:scaffold37761_cov49-Attheya_sp.AAC.4